jgi:superfamily II DNA/RNA helicase
LRVANLIGGQSMGIQLRQLQRNPQIIIGTPGRIYDHLQRKTLNLDTVVYFVLDEMDRMLDLGFSQQIEEIELYLPKERQTLLFSATLPNKTLKQVKRYLSADFVRINDGQPNQPAPKIEHHFENVAGAEKFKNLLGQLEQREGTVVVFVNRKIDAQRLALRLKESGQCADSIHGDLRQNVRDRIMQRFRDQKFRIMVGTDVVARGLDVSHIRHVINYDLPMCPEDYLHRIGRTGRAGQCGSAFSLVGPQDQIKWRAIQRLLNPRSTDRIDDEEDSGSFAPRRRPPFSPRSSSGRGRSSNPFGQKSSFSPPGKRNRW